MSGQTIAMPRGWGKENDPMSLRLVTADHHPRMFDDRSDAAPAAGVVLGVFCGSMFWMGLAIGWMVWG
jgi:hypothetical protein